MSLGIKPEDVPNELVTAVYTRTRAHGIPWHDDAVRILAAAVISEVRILIAREVGEQPVIIDYGTGGRRYYRDAPEVVRSWPKGSA